jgi:mitochondrial enoyl-[acyl-carrier protein] reductase / trans-2-enoyl-CoA reductase
MPSSPAIVFHEFGVPSQVARCESVEVPDPGPGEVLVRMKAAPIHPADLNRLEGRYGEKPELPSVGGIEGFGEVESTGPGVTGLAPGIRVAVAQIRGTWCERVVLPANRLVVVPPGVDDGLAAMLILNPATAWRMLHDFVELQQVEWVILNAANSAVGRCVVEIARAQGWRSLAVVRRAELIGEMTALGADAALLDDDNLVNQVKNLTQGAPPRLALNAVGGASALRLASALAPGGTLVTYGAMGRQPLQIPNGYLIFKELCFLGFWVTQWFRRAGEAETRSMLEGICRLAAKGTLTAQVAATFPLSEAAQALEAAASERRGGKVLFRM